VIGQGGRMTRWLGEAACDAHGGVSFCKIDVSNRWQDEYYH
jgi:hypothetical protein